MIVRHTMPNSRKPLRKLLVALCLLLLVILGGVLGFMYIEGYSFLDALYMTITSVSTVGYGIEKKEAFSPQGKAFVIVFLIGSAGGGVFTLTTLTAFIIEGDLRKTINYFIYRRKIEKMEQHIILCGLGRAGKECVEELMKQDKTFVVIERNKETLDEFLSLSSQRVVVIEGDATLEEILLKANIRQAKALISALPSDAENVFIALTARNLNPALEIIARAEHDYNTHKILRAGANHVILPNYIGGRRMVNLITRPGLVEFIELISGETQTDAQLEAVDCSLYPQLCGRTLGELDIRGKTGLTVVGRKTKEGITDISPAPELVIQQGDRLFLLRNRQGFERLLTMV